MNTNTVNSLMYDNYGSIRHIMEQIQITMYTLIVMIILINQHQLVKYGEYDFTPSGGNQVRIIRNNVINNFKWYSLANEGGWPDAGLHHALNYDYINKNSGACSFASTQTCDFSSTGLK